MADIKSTEERSKNMAAIRSRDTKPEVFVRSGLFSRGYRYRIAPKNVPGHPDIYLAKYKAALFVHGCFWHRHDGCKYAYSPKSRPEFWNAKFESNLKRDYVVKEALQEKGFRQLIIWECSIREALRNESIRIKLFDRIERFLCSDEKYLEIASLTVEK